MFNFVHEEETYWGCWIAHSNFNEGLKMMTPIEGMKNADQFGFVKV